MVDNQILIIPVWHGYPINILTGRSSEVEGPQIEPNGSDFFKEGQLTKLLEVVDLEMQPAAPTTAE
ncbi:hypothetical protein ACQR1I_06725 [Bradyrhizobium sp. HKCCYLS2038]|uniref:hypothetical protein n=1 Tax=unclassified Bradyrhizobium TaxID=2631580 RepID=UPI003EBCAC6A